MHIIPIGLLNLQDFCPAGNACTNQMFRRREYARIEQVRIWLTVTCAVALDAARLLRPLPCIEGLKVMCLQSPAR